jgi:hypothetical protein
MDGSGVQAILKEVVFQFWLLFRSRLLALKCFTDEGRRSVTADHSGRAVQGMNSLRSLERWDRGFESHYKAWMSVCAFILHLYGSTCR